MGTTIAFTIRSVDPSLSTQLIAPTGFDWLGADKYRFQNICKYESN